MLYPNCSESTWRLRTDKLTKEEKKVLDEKLEDIKNFEWFGEETSIFGDEIFGIPAIVIDGDAPYNEYEKLEKELKKLPFYNKLEKEVENK